MARPPRRVAIVQSSYIPWRGVFALAAVCDLFVFLDTVQFTRRDWRTRNRIKTPRGPLWLTIPVKQDGARCKPIDRIEIADPNWAAAHLERIEHVYRRGAGFAESIGFVRDAYARVASHDRLSPVNQGLMQDLSRRLGLSTAFVRDSDLLPRDDMREMDPSHRLAALAAAAGASHYLSGPSARAYLDESKFSAHDIRVEWMSYQDLPPYRQLWGAFEPQVSIVDTLLTLGRQGAQQALGR